MGFVSQVLGDIQGIRYFYMVGMLIFIALFIYILVRTIRMSKKDIIMIKTSILDSNESVDKL